MKLPSLPVALPLAFALAACTTSNTGYPQPGSRGGGWENFRADVSGQPTEAAGPTRDATTLLL